MLGIEEVVTAIMPLPVVEVEEEELTEEETV